MPNLHLLSLENEEFLGWYKQNRPREAKAKIKLFLKILNGDICLLIIVKPEFMLTVNRNSVAQKDVSQYCVAQTIPDIHSKFRNISGLFLSAADRAGCQRMAVGVGT